MTKRKTILLGGVILLLASGAFAGQRTRGGASVRGGKAVAAPPTIQRLGGGVGSVTLNGVTTQINANNSIGLPRVIEEYGSVEGYKAAMVTKNVMSAPSQDDASVSILANNVIGRVQGFTEAANIPELAMEQNIPSSTWEVKGQTMTAFANGVVGIDRNPPVYQRVPGVQIGPIVSADNVIEWTK